MKRKNAELLSSVAGMGAEKAARSLSMLLKVAVSISKPGSALLMNIDEVSARLDKGTDSGGLALCLGVTGDLEGKVLITFPQEDIINVCRQIPRVPKEAGPEHPLVRSALLEMCNILASSFMSAISELTGLDYLACPPEMAIDMLDAIIISVLVDQQRAEQVVFFDTELIIEAEPFRGTLLYLPSNTAVVNLLTLRAGGKKK